MKLKNAMFAWTPSRMCKPHAGQVEVVEKGVETTRLAYTDGAKFSAWRTYSSEERLTRMFALFRIMVIRDGIDPYVADRAFMTVDEYRETLPPDSLLRPPPEGPQSASQ
jgi:hypothetical protein